MIFQEVFPGSISRENPHETEKLQIKLAVEERKTEVYLASQ